MKLNSGFLKFQLKNQFGEKIKIVQIQARFVLKLLIDIKVRDDMQLNWGFLKFQFLN